MDIKLGNPWKENGKVSVKLKLASEQCCPKHGSPLRKGKI